jgi:hypothetical protein
VQFVLVFDKARDAAEVDHGVRLRPRWAHSVSRIAALYCRSSLQIAAPRREEPKNKSALCQETIATWFTVVV